MVATGYAYKTLSLYSDANTADPPETAAHLQSQFSQKYICVPYANGLLGIESVFQFNYGSEANPSAGWSLIWCWEAEVQRGGAIWLKSQS